MGRVQAAQNRVGGQRNGISPNEPRLTNVDRPVWAPRVAAAGVRPVLKPREPGVYRKAQTAVPNPAVTIAARA